jgi:redox-regulated HSP33 family molecular chaperone
MKINIVLTTDTNVQDHTVINSDGTRTRVVVEDSGILNRVRASLFQHGTVLGNGFFRGVITDGAGNRYQALATLAKREIFVGEPAT